MEAPRCSPEVHISRGVASRCKGDSGFFVLATDPPACTMVLCKGGKHLVNVRLANPSVGPSTECLQACAKSL